MIELKAILGSRVAETEESIVVLPEEDAKIPSREVTTQIVCLNSTTLI